MSLTRLANDADDGDIEGVLYTSVQNSDCRSLQPPYLWPLWLQGDGKTVLGAVRATKAGLTGLGGQFSGLHSQEWKCHQVEASQSSQILSFLSAGGGRWAWKLLCVCVCVSARVCVWERETPCRPHVYRQASAESHQRVCIYMFCLRTQCKPTPPPHTHMCARTHKQTHRQTQARAAKCNSSLTWPVNPDDCAADCVICKAIKRTHARTLSLSFSQTDTHNQTHTCTHKPILNTIIDITFARLKIICIVILDNRLH